MEIKLRRGDLKTRFASGVKHGNSVFMLKDAAETLERLRQRMDGSDGGMALCDYGQAEIAIANARVAEALAATAEIASKVYQIHVTVRFNHGDDGGNDATD